MRKVFLWNVLLSDNNKPIRYESPDFVLPNSDWKFSLSHLVEMNVEAGDDVLILSGLTEGQQVQKNFQIFKEEVTQILEAKKAKGSFVDIVEPWEFKDSHVFMHFFKSVIAQLKEGDAVYYDMTGGMKPYSFSMFIAMTYAAKAARDIRVEQVVYVSLYKGAGDKEDVCTIWDLSSLFTLNEIAGNVRPGQKESSDRVLSFIIGDED